MTKTKIWLAAFAIFLSGGVVGGVTTAIMAKHRLEARFEDGTQGRRPFVMERLSRALDLNPQQQQAANEVFAKTMADLQGLRERNIPEARQIIAGGIEELRTHLNPAQNEKLNRMRNHFEARLLERGKGKFGRGDKRGGRMKFRRGAFGGSEGAEFPRDDAGNL